ncbi:peroxiredoxin-like family protein [Sediminibacillus albus]|uniref:AhpC/TSA antioxidant enzyme n=1 Tax=Sediminibacillus albus TaxID=407036 RepID=A0A1G8WP82_9BACI|nr:AhpC/TSA antioxidant enzyme [Sediminibacillus albus]
MREHTTVIESSNVSIAAVLPTDSAQIKPILDVYGPYPFPILGDPERIAYKQLKLKQMSKGKSLRAISSYFFSGRIRTIFPKDTEQRKVIQKAMRSQNVFQLGGTWLIDKTGEILWFHIDAEPADHAKIQTILKVLETISQE